jgi:hypothetical protein
MVEITAQLWEQLKMLIKEVINKSYGFLTIVKLFKSALQIFSSFLKARTVKKPKS